MESSYMTKKELRSEIKRALSSMDPIGKAFESVGYCMKYIQCDEFKNSEVIFGFMPMKDEVDVLPILRAGLSGGKKVLVPRIVPDSNDMEFFYLKENPIAETVENDWGIFEPDTNVLQKANLRELVSDYDSSKITVLVPGLAFGRDMTRLGRGKGFYDKFLSSISSENYQPHFVGVCYSCQLLDSVPHDDHDIKMTEILSLI